jgi:ribonucleoside-diphosphate reductase beta chain
MPINKGAAPVNINNRKIINGGDADVMQLYPMKHHFAWEAYMAGNANHWLPTEISMQRDIEQWKSPTRSRRRAQGIRDRARLLHDRGLHRGQ